MDNYQLGNKRSKHYVLHFMMGQEYDALDQEYKKNSEK